MTIDLSKATIGSKWKSRAGDLWILTEICPLEGFYPCVFRKKSNNRLISTTVNGLQWRTGCGTNDIIAPATKPKATPKKKAKRKSRARELAEKIAHAVVNDDGTWIGPDIANIIEDILKKAKV